MEPLLNDILPTFNREVNFAMLPPVFRSGPAEAYMRRVRRGQAALVSPRGYLRSCF